MELQFIYLIHQKSLTIGEYEVNVSVMSVNDIARFCRVTPLG